MSVRKKLGPAKFKRYRRWRRVPEEVGPRVMSVVQTSREYKDEVGKAAELLGMPAQALWKLAMDEKLEALKKKGLVSKKVVGVSSLKPQQSSLFDV